MKTIGALSVVAMMAVAAPAYAEDFPATPLSPAAPTNLPGENLLPGLPEAVAVFNGVTQPILQPILVPGGATAVAPAAAPGHRHRHHLHWTKQAAHHHHWTKQVSRHRHAHHVG